MRVFIHDMEKSAAESIFRNAGFITEGSVSGAVRDSGAAAVGSRGAGYDRDNRGAKDAGDDRGGRDDIMIINACEKAVFCKGCFGCWLETPGKCVISDRLRNIGSILLQADEITIISRCMYGGYSTEIKRLMDRSIPGVMPFFVHKGGEMHHSARYEGRPALKAIFYNDVPEKMKETAERFVKANGVNFWASSVEVVFAGQDEIAEML